MSKNEKIVVLGLGRAGCELINRMISRKLEGVEFAAILENESMLDFCNGAKKFLINEIHDCKKFFAENFPDTDMIFVINIFGSEKDFAVKIARAAKSSGALTLGIPVSLEAVNEKDMQRFKDYSDAVILSFGYKNSSDDIPLMIVSGLTGLLSQNGYVNLDFYDVQAVLFNSGTAFFGTAYAENESKIETAARNAVKMCGNLDKAKNVLLNFTTGAETTLIDMSLAVRVIEDKLASDAQVIWGHVVDENQGGVRVSLLVSLDDNGYKSYVEMFRHESDENLAVIVKDGLSEVQRFRLGSYNAFFEDALIYGSLKVIKCFLSNGYDPKELELDGVFSEGILSMIIWTRDDAIAVVKLLFNAKISLNENLFEPFCSRKVTPEIYKAFIDYGWNVNSCNRENFTMLMLAVSYQSYKHVKVLIEAGADVNARDDEGKTPLMYIGRINSSEDIKKINLLLENGAKADVEDNDGNCFLQVLFGDFYKKEREGCKRLLRLLAK
ncbi:MAG: ankyrin repeat domain-containing protein [Synergistaceae bacterium]|nr:ankyrin repeat domain-containing protein [Synergistaceae bacterium]